MSKRFKIERAPFFQLQQSGTAIFIRRLLTLRGGQSGFYLKLSISEERKGSAQEHENIDTANNDSGAPFFMPFFPHSSPGASHYFLTPRGQRLIFLATKLNQLCGALTFAEAATQRKRARRGDGVGNEPHGLGGGAAVAGVAPHRQSGAQLPAARLPRPLARAPLPVVQGQTEEGRHRHLLPRLPRLQPLHRTMHHQHGRRRQRPFLHVVRPRVRRRSLLHLHRCHRRSSPGEHCGLFSINFFFYLFGNIYSYS
jgi:hypothetical protein